jgi:hypothetical protein
MSKKIDVTTLDRSGLAGYVIKRFKVMQSNGNDIQQAMLCLLDPMRDWSAVEIVKDDALLSVFQSETSGKMRTQLTHWVETYTPIRVKWEYTKEGLKTGRVTGLKMAKKGGEWNLSGAKVNPWYEVDAPVAMKAAAAPDLERGIKALIRQAARLFDADSTVTMDEIKRMIAKEVVDNLSTRILDERATEKHNEWLDRFTKERAEAEAIKASKAGRETKAETVERETRHAELEAAKSTSAKPETDEVVTADDLDSALIAALMATNGADAEARAH